MAQRQPGYAFALLQISSEKTIDQNVALAAAVQLGSLVEIHWKYRDEGHARQISTEGFQFIILSEQHDKQKVRESIVQKIYECQN